MSSPGGLRPSVLGAAVALLFGCESDVTIEPSGGGGQSSTSSSSSAQSGASESSTAISTSGPDTASSSGVGAAPTMMAECQGHIYECGDLIDNDGDGRTDSFDYDCLGACDNTEDSIGFVVSSRLAPPCLVDCQFDGNPGWGDDDCRWSHRCDINEVAPDYYPEPGQGDQCEYAGPLEVVEGGDTTCAELATTQSAQCASVCGPLTPNGCDCFGCCEVPGSSDYVWLASTGIDSTTVCTMSEIDNPDVCHPCDPVVACWNDCGPCEVCVGKPTPDAGCTTAEQCEPGAQPCGLEGQLECPADFYCVTGCCRTSPG
ncbi:MAG: hypothetical protein HOV80_04015 [Polyangiaceae bacterium]|nr:hypothetical protein [Polyangiaceae bacterium]